MGGTISSGKYELLSDTMNNDMPDNNVQSVGKKLSNIPCIKRIEQLSWRQYRKYPKCSRWQHIMIPIKLTEQQESDVRLKKDFDCDVCEAVQSDPRFSYYGVNEICYRCIDSQPVGVPDNRFCMVCVIIKKILMNYHSGDVINYVETFTLPLIELTIEDGIKLIDGLNEIIDFRTVPRIKDLSEFTFSDNFPRITKDTINPYNKNHLD